jgi:hypothetical protein
MAAARADKSHFDRLVHLASAFALAAMTAACAGGMDPGYAVVSQDRFDFMTCGEIIAARNGNNGRLKQLTELIEKAESSPGGFIAGAVAYRSELLQVRGLAAAADRAARMHNCDATKK